MERDGVASTLPTWQPFRLSSRRNNKINPFPTFLVSSLDKQQIRTSKKAVRRIPHEPTPHSIIVATCVRSNMFKSFLNRGSSCSWFVLLGVVDLRAELFVSWCFIDNRHQCLRFNCAPKVSPRIVMKQLQTNRQLHNIRHKSNTYQSHFAHTDWFWAAMPIREQSRSNHPEMFLKLRGWRICTNPIRGCGQNVILSLITDNASTEHHPFLNW